MAVLSFVGGQSTGMRHASIAPTLPHSVQFSGPACVAFACNSKERGSATAKATTTASAQSADTSTAGLR